MNEPAHILIVDDEPYNRVILEEALGAHFVLHGAADGAEALAHLRGGGRADLILSDIVMPNMDGFALCRRLKADPATQDIPLLFLSGLDSAASEEEGLALGAEDFIHKPFSPPSVLARVRSHLRLARVSRQLREQNRNLEAANRELERFGYTISHDLRAPLRALDGYAQILAEECAGRLDAEERSMLERIRANAQRMGGMIDDLLELARLARSEIVPRRIDLSALAADIVAALRAAERGREVRVTVAPDLNAWGDPAQIRIVLENLLGNAWKYTGATPAADIRFEARTEDGRRLFCVEDNGAGFDMAFADKLFQPFQRLHSPERFPGTGVGLATVEGILRRHGGGIRASAAPGRGAAFCFWLPERANAGNDNFEIEGEPKT